MVGQSQERMLPDPQRPAAAEDPYHNVGDTERWISLAGGAAALLAGLRMHGAARLMVAGLGGALLYRGATAHCPVSAAIGRNTAGASESAVRGPIYLRTAVTIDRGRADLYSFWRDFTNLPRFMRHLREVRTLEDGRSHWVAELRGRTLEWQAEVTADVTNERIAWRSLEGADVANQGEVRFVPAPGSRGTELQVEMVYEPPAGALGRAAGRLLAGVTHGMIRQDLQRLKQLMESGEVTTAAIQRPHPSEHAPTAHGR